MTRTAGRLRRLLIMVVVLLTASTAFGCVSVPTSGRVEPVDQGPRRNDTKPEAVPKPPVRDATPRVIIDGFLFAMSRYQPRYEIAREFLTQQSKESWRPEDKITIYTNPKYDSTESNVKLTMTRVGEVGPDGSYSARSGPQVHDFGMQQDKNGQWRIGNPPEGLLISDTAFSANFTSYNLYFFDTRFRTLVPDPIYLPTDGQTESALVQALLRGPTAWLRPAVGTAFPARTALVGNSVPVSGNFAQITLSPHVNDLNDDERTRLAAQLAWTLRQVRGSELAGIQLTVEGDRFRVPRQIGEGQSAYIPITYGSEFGPVPTQQSSTLLGVNNDSVVAVDNDGARLAPVEGRFGQPNYKINSLAQSADGQTIAAVTDNRKVLRTQVKGDNQPRTQLFQQRNLLRPEYTRWNELWAISGPPNKQTIRMLVDGEEPVRVTAPWVRTMEITAFQISPDGSRMALVGRRGDRQVLALAPILRGDEVSLGNIRTVELMDSAAASVQRIADIGWISPTRLLILGAASEGASFEPYGVEIDGSQFERVGTSDNWGATSLSTRVESGGSFQAVVAGRGNRVWSYESGDEWRTLSDDLAAPTYAG